MQFSEQFPEVNTNTMLELLEGSLFVIDDNKNWSYLSENWQKYTGIAAEGLLGTPACDVFEQEDRTNLLEVVGGLLAGDHNKATHEMRYLKAGDTCHAELFMQIHTNAAEVSVVLGIFRDITERKNAEEAISHSEQYKQDILNHSPSMMARFDKTLRITFANPAYTAFFDKQVDEVVGESLFALLPLSQHNQTRNNLSSLSKYDPQHVFENWITRFNGERRYQRWTNRVFFDENGHVNEYQTEGIDLTEHKMTQDALRQGQATFRKVLDNAADVIVTVDLDLNLHYISLSWERVIGYPLESFTGKSAVELIHPEDVNVVLKGFIKILAGARLEESLHYQVSHADGQWHWHAGRGAPIVDASGQVVGAVLISRDVTNAYERQMSLQRALAQLEQDLAAKNTLLFEMHHRVKNNLQTVASLLNIQSKRLKDAQAKDALMESHNRVIAIAQIHTMLHQHDNEGEVIIDDYVYALIDRVKQVCDASEITFTVEGDRFALPLKKAVPLGLSINELLINAIKYAFPAVHPNPQVTVHLEHVLEQDRAMFTIGVVDNGTGLPAGFDPFTADTLGMTIVRSLAAQLDGTVTFANHSEGQGLQVTVTAPDGEARGGNSTVDAAHQ